MEIWTGEYVCLKASRSVRDGIGERGRTRRVDNLASFAQPSAIEDSISRRAEGTSGLRVPLEITFVIVVRGGVTPATLSEVPPQLVGGRWAKRIRKLLLPCPLVRGLGFAKVARDPQAQRPTTERSEQFGMAQEERSEVHGRRTRDEIAEDVLASLVNDADGELVGKKADASSDTITEGNVREIFLVQASPQKPAEVRQLVALACQPRHARGAQDCVKDHHPLDGHSNRSRLPEPAMWLSNSVVERAMMQVKDASPLVGTGIGGRELPLDKESEEVRRVLSVGNTGESAVVPVHADSGVQHDRD